ncbi:MAG TPA: 4'-phosphopantetheinyl transferase superfamily protein [Solirubrobacteraceae bacterium]|jgi:4'-phosphopantetheinyl transferase|nr:4'-phosphopantetheinyl transferase superfamily protein [Solirubrobacteraceae bacterium]
MGREAIPALGVGVCQIWWADTSAALVPLLDLLDEGERGRHLRFLRAQDRALFLIAHALTRILAARHAGCEPGGLTFAPATPGAKPRFAGPASELELELSLSHSGRHAVVALSRGVAIGVDVERVGPVREEERSFVASVLTRSEQRTLALLGPSHRAWGFYRYWTRKEAVLKATGDGLAVSPKLIGVSAPTEPPLLTWWAGPRAPAQPFYLYDLDHGPRYPAALAAMGTPLEVTTHDGSALLRAWSRAGVRAGRRGR